MNIKKGDKIVILRHLYPKPSYFWNTKLEVLEVFPENNSVKVYFMGDIIIHKDCFKKVKSK
jgi:hypothetical protein